METPIPGSPGRDWIDPYVRLPATSRLDHAQLHSAALIAALSDRATMVATELVAALKSHDTSALPPVVLGLHQETDGFLTQRIVNMVSALSRFLSAPAHADVREKLAPVFWPMTAWVKGQYCVTTPALLLIHAILYCHVEWFRNHAFEAHSAKRAWQELQTQGFPGTHCCFVAAVISHQTLLRAAWSAEERDDPREVFALHRRPDNTWEWLVAPFAVSEGPSSDRQRAADRVVGRVLARTLFRFVSNMDDSTADPASPSEPYERSQLAAAAVLHALCLACKYSANDPTALDVVKAQALPFLDHLLRSDAGSPSESARIAYFHYGKYVYPESHSLLESSAAFVLKKAQTIGQTDNLTFSFQRVSRRSVWHGREFDNERIRPVDVDSAAGLTNPRSSLAQALSATVGRQWTYELQRQDYLSGVLGISESGATEWSETSPALERFGRLLEATLAVHCQVTRTDGFDPAPYAPTPLIGQVLRQMREVHPECFTRLEIVCNGIKAAKSAGAEKRHVFPVWLPRRAEQIKSNPMLPGPEEGENLAPDLWCAQARPAQHPEFFIARYVAAMVMAHAVSFAPRDITLDFGESEQRAIWSHLIERALLENGGCVIQSYLEQVRCEPGALFSHLQHHPPAPMADALSRRRLAAANPTSVLGVDIGGTAIKAQLFRVTAEKGASDVSFSSVPESIVEFNWGELETAETGPRASWGLSKEYGLESPAVIIEKAIAKSNATCEAYHCVAAGIAVAAPVSHGSPAAIGTLISYFKNFSKHAADGNPVQIHRLDFTASVRARGWSAVCLNDGDADLRDGADDVAATGDGLTLVLKAGTGVAFGVYLDGQPLGYVSETSKAILNLCATPDVKDKYAVRFPRGVIGEYCSKKVLDLDRRSSTLPTSVTDGRALNTLLTKALQLHNHLQGEPQIEGPVPLRDLVKAASAARDQRIGHSVVGNSAPQSEEPASLHSELWSAVYAASILGRWLADAIALSVDLFGAREVRLAGGPLSGSTGLFVTAAAETALERVYGFDVERVLRPTANSDDLQRRQGAVRPHPLSVRRLRLIYPPEASAETGPRGAAKEAFDRYVSDTKWDQLQRCRDRVSKQQMERPFDLDAIVAEAKCDKQQETQTKSRWILSYTEVENFLSREASSLGLTRMHDGQYMRLATGRV